MNCPICKKPVAIPVTASSTDSADEATRFFPFCSERCKLIDLGRWLDGKYQIPVKPPASLEAESEADA